MDVYIYMQKQACSDSRVQRGEKENFSYVLLNFLASVSHYYKFTVCHRFLLCLCLYIFSSIVVFCLFILVLTYESFLKKTTVAKINIQGTGTLSLLLYEQTLAIFHNLSYQCLTLVQAVLIQGLQRARSVRAPNVKMRMHAVL